jgi:hypothetical protein
MAIGPAWRKYDLIFPSALGTPLDPDNVWHRFSRVCQRLASALAAAERRDSGAS